MAPKSEPRRARTYGGWRRPTSPGLGRLGLAPTTVMFAGIIAMIVSFAVSWMLAVLVAAATALAIIPLAYHDRHGRTVLHIAGSRASWWRTRMRGGHLYRSGPLARFGAGRCRLPGLAAAIDAIDASDALGRSFGMLVHPKIGHTSVVLSSSPDGGSLVDEDQLDTWVAHWGDWLASLATEPNLVGASVTIETAPDTGARLHREIEDHLASDAPDLAVTVLRSVVADRAGSAKIASRIALTWSMVRDGKRLSRNEMALEIGQRLPGIAARLAATGAGAARAMTSSEIASVVRVAYDPTAHNDVEEVGAADTGIAWADAGPVAADERWDSYHHDSAWSTSWLVTVPPRGVVTARVLAALLAPHPTIPLKRVTLLYRPHTPADAARVVERDRLNTLFRAQGRKIGHARDHAAVRDANQAAEEEAAGAGLVRFSMLVTATVETPEELPQARRTVEDLAVSCRLTIRPAFGSQASAFTMALPLGLVPPDHLRVPQLLREAM